MSQTLTISDALYSRLEAAARRRGLSSVEQLLEEIFANLASAGYAVRSEKTAVYNCIAYAGGDVSRRWEGYRELGYHWPDGPRKAIHSMR